MDPRSLVTNDDYAGFSKAAGIAKKSSFMNDTSVAVGLPTTRMVDAQMGQSNLQIREKSKSARQGGTSGRKQITESISDETLVIQARRAEKFAKIAEANAIRLITIFSSWNGGDDQSIDEDEHYQQEDGLCKHAQWRGLGIETVASFLLQVQVPVAVLLTFGRFIQCQISKFS